jgi:hypothetical protein
MNEVYTTYGILYAVVMGEGGAGGGVRKYVVIIPRTESFVPEK